MNMGKKQIILGIDPGTRITGYGIIEVQSHAYVPLDYGAIRPPAKLPLLERYLIINEGIESLLEKYPIDAVATETQYVSKNAQSALKLGMAKGVALLPPTKRGLTVAEYAPSQAKLAVTGTGSADKYKVQKMIKALLSLPEPPTPEDAADALALAICHAHHQEKLSCMTT